MTTKTKYSNFIESLKKEDIEILNFLKRGDSSGKN